ncbi:MAG: GIY-YIG nuclease family protein [Dehalococcoidia bacterium]|nr:GIY-YIG nuclease family protein [Dehalococcoidia bacterium]
MAGRGFRGGGFRGGRSYGGRPRSSGRSSRRGSSSGSNKSSKSRTGKSSQNKAVVYSIYNSKGKRTYVGMTNNPGRRAAQHARSGKLTRGGEMVVESGRMPRRSAERLEAKKIQGYQRRTGRLPMHNKTSDGQYRFWD